LTSNYATEGKLQNEHNTNKKKMTHGAKASNQNSEISPSRYCYLIMNDGVKAYIGKKKVSLTSSAGKREISATKTETRPLYLFPHTKINSQ
jgi:hypothetical protein